MQKIRKIDRWAKMRDYCWVYTVYIYVQCIHLYWIMFEHIRQWALYGRESLPPSLWLIVWHWVCAHWSATHELCSIWYCVLNCSSAHMCSAYRVQMNKIYNSDTTYVLYSVQYTVYNKYTMHIHTEKRFVWSYRKIRYSKNIRGMCIAQHTMFVHMRHIRTACIWRMFIRKIPILSAHCNVCTVHAPHIGAQHPGAYILYI